MREPQLAHEEVVKLEAQTFRDVGIGTLLVRQSDVEPDRAPARIRGAAIRGLHDAGAATGADEEAIVAGLERLRPFGDHAGQLASLAVVAAQRAVFCQPRGAEEDDRVVDSMLAECAERLQILREDSQRTAIVALEEIDIEVSESL